MSPPSTPSKTSPAKESSTRLSPSRQFMVRPRRLSYLSRSLDGDEEFGTHQSFENLSGFASTSGDRAFGRSNGLALNQDRFLQCTTSAIASLTDIQIKRFFYNAFYTMNQRVNEALSLASQTSLVADDAKDSGSTGLVCMMQKNGILLAGAGDCRATLVYKKGDQYHVKHLTQGFEHRATDSKEKERIEACGGEVVNARLERGGLSITRGFSAQNYVPYGFTFSPYIQMIRTIDDIPLEQLESPILLVSSDGFWEYIKDEDFAEIFVQDNHLDLTEKAKKLRKKAYQNGSPDNITVGMGYLSEGLVMGGFDGFGISGNFGAVAAQAALEKSVEIFANPELYLLPIAKPQPFLNSKSHFPQTIRSEILSHVYKKAFTNMTPAVVCTLLNDQLYIAKNDLFKISLIYIEDEIEKKQELNNEHCEMGVFSFQKIALPLPKCKYYISVNDGLEKYEVCEGSLIAFQAIDAQAIDSLAFERNLYKETIHHLLDIPTPMAMEKEVNTLKAQLTQDGVSETWWEAHVSGKIRTWWDYYMVWEKPDWKRCIEIAAETRDLIQTVTSEQDSTLKLNKLDQYYHHCLDTKHQKIWKTIVSIGCIVLGMIVGAVIGACVGALVTAPFGGAGGVLGAVEGAAEGAAAMGALTGSFVAGGMPTKVGLCHLYQHFIHPIETKAAMTIKNVHDYPALLPVCS